MQLDNKTIMEGEAMKEIKTASQLKKHHEELNPGSHFFDADTMKHWGDSMSNYGVEDAGECWELYRKKPVKGGLDTSAYFDKQTMKRVFK